MRKALLTPCLIFGSVVILTLASCSGGPAPSGGPGEGVGGVGAERLLLSEAVEKAQAHLARLGYPEAQLWRIEGGLELGQDGRAVWKLHLCDPASQRDILYDFEYAQEDQRAVVGQDEMPEPCTPLGDIAAPDQVAVRNPQIWQLVAEKEEAAQQLLAEFPRAPEKLFRVKVRIGLAPFTGPSATYEHGRDAWVVTVDYPTEVDEQGRVVSEGCRFWAALDTGEPLYDECAGEEGGAESEQPVPPPPGGQEAAANHLQWRQYEDFQTGNPRSRWQLSGPGGCEPSSSEAVQYIDGWLHQGARGGGMDGRDCASFTATRDFPLPAGFKIGRLDLKVSWQVPEFSSPNDPHGGKEGYADLVVIPLDDQGQELGRLRIRVSCDDRSGQGTPYCAGPDYGMNDGSRVLLVHGQGQVTDWQQLVSAPTSELPVEWGQARTIRVTFEFAAGYLYEDEWAVQWDDLELKDVSTELALQDRETSLHNWTILSEIRGGEEGGPGLRDITIWNDDGMQAYLEVLLSTDGCISGINPPPFGAHWQEPPPQPVIIYCVSEVARPGEAWWESLWRSIQGGNVYARKKVWAKKRDWLHAWGTQLGPEIEVKIAPPVCEGPNGHDFNCGQARTGREWGDLPETGWYGVQWKVPRGLFLSALGVTVDFAEPLSLCQFQNPHASGWPYRLCVR